MFFKQLDLKLGIHCIHFIFLIPQSLSKIYKQIYKNLEYGDYCIGEFKQIHSYTKDYNKEREIYHIRVFTTPHKAKKIRFEFITDLDDYLKNERVCGFKILTEYIWGTNRRWG